MTRCPSPKSVRHAIRLSSDNVEGKLPRHAQRRFHSLAIHDSHPLRPPTDRVRECRVATPVGDPQKGKTTPEASSLRSPVLDVPHEDLETMENGAGHRAA